LKGAFYLKYINQVSKLTKRRSWTFRRRVDRRKEAKCDNRSDENTCRDSDTDETTDLAFSFAFHRLRRFNCTKCADVAIRDREDEQVQDDEPVLVEERNIESYHEKCSHEDYPE